MTNQTAKDHGASDGTLALERAIGELDQIAALRFDGAGHVLSCNEAMGRFLGRPARELQDAALELVLTPPDAAALRALLRDGRPHVAGRVLLAFHAAAAQAPVTLECTIALEAGGGALLGSLPDRGGPVRRAHGTSGGGDDHAER